MGGGFTSRERSFVRSPRGNNNFRGFERGGRPQGLPHELGRGRRSHSRDFTNGGNGFQSNFGGRRPPGLLNQSRTSSHANPRNYRDRPTGGYHNRQNSQHSHSRNASNLSRQTHLKNKPSENSRPIFEDRSDRPMFEDAPTEQRPILQAEEETKSLHHYQREEVNHSHHQEQEQSSQIVFDGLKEAEQITDQLLQEQDKKPDCQSHYQQ